MGSRNQPCRANSVRAARICPSVTVTIVPPSPRNAPLYRRIRRGDLTLDLSGHHGDGTPGTALWIPVDDVHALRDELHSGAPGLPRPEVDADAPGGPTLSLQDPFGNELRFCQPE